MTEQDKTPRIKKNTEQTQHIDEAFADFFYDSFPNNTENVSDAQLDIMRKTWWSAVRWFQIKLEYFAHEEDAQAEITPFLINIVKEMRAYAAENLVENEERDKKAKEQQE